MKRGTQFAYLSTRSAGDITHGDTRFGFIVGPTVGASVRVWFWTIVGVELQPATTFADATIMKLHDSVEQSVVDKILAEVA